jgi:hypothetical protein
MCEEQPSTAATSALKSAKPEWRRQSASDNNASQSVWKDTQAEEGWSSQAAATRRGKQLKRLRRPLKADPSRRPGQESRASGRTEAQDIAAVQIQKRLAQQLVELEADVSGTDSGDEDSKASGLDGELSGDFINDGSYTQSTILSCTGTDPRNPGATQDGGSNTRRKKRRRRQRRRCEDEFAMYFRVNQRLDQHDASMTQTQEENDDDEDQEEEEDEAEEDDEDQEEEEDVGSVADSDSPDVFAGGGGVPRFILDSADRKRRRSGASVQAERGAGQRSCLPVDDTEGSETAVEEEDPPQQPLERQAAQTKRRPGPVAAPRTTNALPVVDVLSPEPTPAPARATAPIIAAMATETSAAAQRIVGRPPRKIPRPALAPAPVIELDADDQW